LIIEKSKINLQNNNRLEDEFQEVKTHLLQFYQ